MIILETIKVTHFFSDHWIMVINSHCSNAPRTLHKWCAVKIGTHIVHHSYCTIFTKEEKERWTMEWKLLRKKASCHTLDIWNMWWPTWFLEASFLQKRGTPNPAAVPASHTSLLSFVEVITPQRSYGTAQEGERGDETFIQGISNHLVDIVFAHYIGN